MRKKIGVLRILLIPFSVIYSFIMQIRNYFYDFNILSICKSETRIISVGNITTGGTGKTPFVIFLSKLLLNKGMKVGIISRGYGRKFKKMITVYDGNKLNENIDQTGDELALIAFELIKEYRYNFFAVASSDRCIAAKYITDNFKPDVIILDDAFQHRKIHRDKNIVIIDYKDFLENKFYYKFTIPSGDLRENMSNLTRADLIVINTKEDLLQNRDTDLFDYNVPVIKIKYKTEYLIDYKNTIFNFGNKKAVIFSGIAKPYSFIKALEDKGIIIQKELIFKDHHDYSQSDIDKLISFHLKDSVFITTGKDFMKVRKFQHFIETYPVYYLQLEIEIAENIDLLKILE